MRRIALKSEQDGDKGLCLFVIASGYALRHSSIASERLSTGIAFGVPLFIFQTVNPPLATFPRSSV